MAQKVKTEFSILLPVWPLVGSAAGMKEHAYFFSSCSVLVLGVQNIFCSRSVLVRENQQNFVLVLFSFSNKNMFPNKFSNKIDLHFVIFFKLR